MTKTRNSVLIDGKNPDYLTYESRDGAIVVHAWGTYDAHSVLAGQPLKQFVDSLDSVKAVLALYPEAEASHPMLQPQNTFHHLPDTPDY